MRKLLLSNTQGKIVEFEYESIHDKKLMDMLYSNKWIIICNNSGMKYVKTKKGKPKPAVFSIEYVTTKKDFNPTHTSPYDVYGEENVKETFLSEKSFLKFMDEMDEKGYDLVTYGILSDYYGEDYLLGIGFTEEDIKIFETY